VLVSARSTPTSPAAGPDAGPRPRARTGGDLARPADHRTERRTDRPTDRWLRLATGTALLALAGSILALLDIEGSYGAETENLLQQAVAQDAVNVVVVAPAILVLSQLARRGSLTATLLWLGALAFTAYSYVIYTFSLHFGPLFLVWVAVLGGSLYALIGGLAAVDAEAVRARLADAPTRPLAWLLLGVAMLFTLAWLGDIVPALVSGDAPRSARDAGLPTNPVHVLDLAFFLPAVFATGVLLLRRRPFAYAVAPGLVVFLVLTMLPALATPFVAAARGGSPAWGLLAPFAVLTVGSVVVLARFLRAARDDIA
jgi:hypothetical protein